MAPNADYPPVTEEQLRFFAELEKHAVNSALRRAHRQAAAGFLALAIGIGAAFYTQSHDSAAARKATVKSGRAVSVDGCNRDFRSTDRFRGLIVRLKVANLQSTSVAIKRATDPTIIATLKEQRAAAQAFYSDTLDSYLYPNCGAARSIVTDDPNKTIIVPRPLTSADAQNSDVPAAIERVKKG